MTENTLPPTVRRLRQCVLFCVYALVLLFFVVSSNITTQLSITTIIIWFLQTFPLLAFLPALHRTHARAYAWLSFVVLIYFIHGVVAAFTEQRFWLGLTETLLCCILFVALILFIRKYRESFNVPI